MVSFRCAHAHTLMYMQMNIIRTYMQINIIRTETLGRHTIKQYTFTRSQTHRKNTCRQNRMRAHNAHVLCFHFLPSISN